MLKYFAKRYKELPVPAKASIWFVLCYVLQRGIQFLGMPIYTRLMTQEQYGNYTVFLSWFNIIVVFSSLNIYTGAFTKGLVKYDIFKAQYVSSIQCLSVFFSLLFGLLIVLFSPIIERITGLNFLVQVLLIFHLVSFPVLQLWSLDQRAQYKYKGLLLVTLLNSVLSFGIGVIAVFYATDKSTALILVTVIVQLLICFFLFVQQVKAGKCFFDRSYWLWTIGLAVPLIPHALSEILLNHANRIMIAQICGVSQAGIYTIVYQISMVMTIIRGGINGSFTPWMYYSIRDKNYESVRRTTNLLAVFMGVMTALIMAIGPEILKIAAPPSYYEAVKDIPAIMIGCHFIFIYLLFANVEIYYEQKRYVTTASVIAALTNIGLNYLLIPVFGYLVAGYTTMISYFFMAVLHLWFLSKVSRKNPEIKDIFDVKFLFFSSLVLFIAGFFLYMLYDYCYIRLFVVVITVVILYVKREYFMTGLKIIKSK